MGTRYNDAWVAGATSYLGHELAKALQELGYTVYATGNDVDISDREQVDTFMSRNRPQVVINCAGLPRPFVTPDRKLEAMRQNALGPRNLAAATAAIDSLLVQVSAKEVFASQLTEPVDEFDSPHPDSLYGKTKRAGEWFVRELNPKHIIVRSSWVYHYDGGQLKNIITAAQAGEQTIRRTDQVAAPTSVDFVVKFITQAIHEGEYGVFHAVTTGSCSRYEFAREVYRLLGCDPDLVLPGEVDGITAQSTVLESMMLPMTGLVEQPAWQEELARYLKSAMSASA